jgi:5-methylcytosine-specific restriction endonuclease McrA
MGKWRRNRSLSRRWQKNHLINKYGAVCYYCGLAFEKKKDITFDHYVPTSKGGFDELSNLRLAHFACNHVKNNMLPEEFEIFQKGGHLVE